MWPVIGQDRAVSLLEQSLRKDCLAHAYLFVGPAHVGKMTLALGLAQALNCAAAERPCGRCPSCQKIASAKHADVQVVGLRDKGEAGETRPGVEISIDQVRQVQHAASLPPFEGRHKVFIIDRAELLSTEAANCLLKTLEEPVGKVLFILLTMNERLLPLTVVSRCQRVELRPLAVGEVEAALVRNWDVEPAKAKLLARLSHGCLGWAVAAALDGGLLRQRAERLDELLDVIDADYDERFAGAAQWATQFAQSRDAIRERLDLWLDWWRDLLLVKAGASDNVVNIDRLDTLISLADRFSLAQTKTFIDSIRAAGVQLRLNANPQLVLEVLMLSMPETERRSAAGRAAV